MPQSIASCNLLTLLNWPAFHRQSKMAQLHVGMPSKACQEWEVTIMKLHVSENQENLNLLKCIHMCSSKSATPS